MIKRIIIYVIILCLFGAHPTYTQNYFYYHQQVNRAETFVANEHFTKALEVYDSVFSQYNFCFVKDYIIALQVAVLSDQQENAKSYAYQAVKGGAKLQALEGMPLLRPVIEKPFWQAVRGAADSLRRSYLTSIDIKTNRTLSRRYRMDEDGKSDKSRSQDIFLSNFKFIESYIDTAGFPGERAVGIDNADFDPPGTNSLARLGDRGFGNSKVVVPLLHYNRAIELLGLPVFLQAIESGRLHPCEFAHIYTFEVDMDIRQGHRKQMDIPLPAYHFQMAMGLKTSDTVKCNNDRAAFGILSLETTQQLIETAAKYGMVVTLDYKR